MHEKSVEIVLDSRSLTFFDDACKISPAFLPHLIENVTELNILLMTNYQMINIVAG